MVASGWSGWFTLRTLATVSIVTSAETSPTTGRPVPVELLSPEEAEIAQLASALRLAVMRTARRLRSQDGDAEISLTQLSALGTIAKCGPLSAGSVAAIERVQPPSMTKALSSLEERGLIARSVAAADRRQSVIWATQAGLDLLAAAVRVRDEWVARRLQALTQDELEMARQTIHLLDRLGAE